MGRCPMVERPVLVPRPLFHGPISGTLSCVLRRMREREARAKGKKRKTTSDDQRVMVVLCDGVLTPAV